MRFQCSKCGSWNTYAPNALKEGTDGVCFDCHSFYKMGKPEFNWNLLWKWLLVTIVVIIILYSIKFLLNFGVFK